MVSVERALLRWHEIVYAVGVETFRHDNSGPSERVILHAFGQDLTPDRLAFRIKENGFGDWLTLAQFKKTIEEQIQVPAANMRLYLTKVLARLRTSPVVPLPSSSGSLFSFGSGGTVSFESIFTEDEHRLIFDLKNIYASVRRDIPLALQKWALRFSCEAIPARKMLDFFSPTGMGLFSRNTDSGPEAQTFGFDDVYADASMVTALNRVCPTKALKLIAEPLTTKGDFATFTLEAIKALGLRVVAIDQLISSFPAYTPTAVDVLRFEAAAQAEGVVSKAAPAVSDTATRVAAESAARNSAEAVRIANEINLKLEKALRNQRSQEQRLP